MWLSINMSWAHWYGMETGSSAMPDVSFYTYCSAHLNMQGILSVRPLRLQKDTPEKANFLFDNIYSTVCWGMCWNRRTIFILIRSVCTDRTVNTLIHTIRAAVKICSHLNTAKTQEKMTLHNNAQTVKQKNKSLSQHPKSCPKICRETLLEAKLSQAKRVRTVLIDIHISPQLID